MGELKVQRINNVHWMSYLAEPIIKLAEILKHPTITPQSLHMHLSRIVEMSQSTDMVELWGVFDEDWNCVAFADWCVRTSPYIGTVYLEYAYSWNRKREPFKLLLEEWIKYGERKFAKPFYMGDVINESVMKVFDRVAKDFGYEYKRSSLINVTGWKNG